MAYGICQNKYGGNPCQLAKDKVVQEADKSNFFCKNCGKPLKEVPAPPPPGSFWDKIKEHKRPIIIGVVILLLAGLGYGIYSFTDDSTQKTPNSPNDTGQNDTIILVKSITPESSSITLKEGDEAKLNYSIIPDSCNEKIEIVSSNPEVASVENGVIKGIKAGRTQIVVKASKSEMSATIDITVKKKGTEPTPPRVSWGNYSGPANGLGGTITVTKSYALDLHDDGEPLLLSPGDEIQQTKFTNGELRAGVWVHNGSRRSFTR